MEENLRGSREPDRGRQAGHRGEHGLGPTNGADDSGVELQAPLELTRFGISLYLSHRHPLPWGAGQSCTAIQYRYQQLVAVAATAPAVDGFESRRRRMRKDQWAAIPEVEKNKGAGLV